MMNIKKAWDAFDSKLMGNLEDPRRFALADKISLIAMGWAGATFLGKSKLHGTAMFLPIMDIRLRLRKARKLYHSK